jgi:hypothetical protein
VLVRNVYEVLVEACPEAQRHLSRDERDITVFRVVFAGPMHSMFMDIERGLWAERLLCIRTLSFQKIRKARGREGPGILSINAVEA